MQSTSLRVRLLLAAAIAIAVALIVSGALLAKLFARHVERRAVSELQTYLNQVVAGLEPGTDGTLQSTSPPADPRFVTPYGGLYWQVDVSGGRRLRSRSLWDFELAPPAQAQASGMFRHEVPGPGGARMLAIERALTIETPAKRLPLRVIVAVDRREIDEATAQFRTVLWSSLAVIGSALIATFGAMLHVGLLPLRRLSRSLRKVQSGQIPTVEGDYPAEVQALVSDMNRLLEQQRQSIRRAREQASDLAHGFKTPLAVLSAVSRDLHREGRATAAGEIDSQVDAMSRHVRRELARTRTAGASAVQQGGIAVRPVVDKIVAAMRRIAGDRDLDWSASGDAQIGFAGDETDLLEMIGNLCENAGKWARSVIRVDVEAIGATVSICVDDDGPGIAAGAEVDALVRGKRLDESAEGSGLGLAIVAKAVAAYGGQLYLMRSPLGGLRARLSLPAAMLTRT